jgi:hypothetical protein
MFLIVFYLLSPFPLAIAKHFGNGSNGGTSPEIELALFVTSGIGK